MAAWSSISDSQLPSSVKPLAKVVSYTPPGSPQQWAAPAAAVSYTPPGSPMRQNPTEERNDNKRQSSSEESGNPLPRRRQGLIRTGTLMLDGTVGDQALVISRHVDDGVPLHPVMPRRVAGAKPEEVAAFLVWNDRSGMSAKVGVTLPP